MNLGYNFVTFEATLDGGDKMNALFVVINYAHTYLLDVGVNHFCSRFNRFGPKFYESIT